MNIVDLEQQLDRRLQKPRVTGIAAAHTAAMAWSGAVWSLAESAGPSIVTADEIERG